MGLKRRASAFTLIELLTVIAIIMLVMALALPNFVAMMKERKWGAAIGNMQNMVMRARALASNVRRDFSVEFDIQADNGTRMWLEAEVNDLERIPDLWDLQHEVGGYPPLLGFMKGTFREAGGTYDSSSPLNEFTCAQCGNQWVLYGYYNDAVPCPKCGHGRWNSLNYHQSFWYNFAYNPANADPRKYADNTRQSEVVWLGAGVTIDPARCSNFVSWDAPDTYLPYGKDDYPDIRIGTNGALVQTRDPVICLKAKGAEERRAVTVVRCTGRVIPTPMP